MKITKRERERVAELLSMLACQPEEWDLVTQNIKGFSCRHREIARQAACRSLESWESREWRAAYAEAEAMIRTGWTP